MTWLSLRRPYSFSIGLLESQRRCQTEVKKTLLNTTFMAKLKHITKYHERALELKYKGYSYQNIAEDINHRFEKSRKAKFTEQTVKDWFKQSGTLQETYRLYAQELDLIHQETVDIVRKAGVRVREQNFRLANEMLVALMGSQND